MRAGNIIARSKVAQAASTALALRVIGWLVLLTAATTYPYKINTFYDHLHVWSSVALIASEIAAGVHFWRLGRSTACTWLFVLQLIGFLLTALTFLGLLHVLFIGEMLSGLTFGMLAARALWEVAHRKLLS